MDRIKLPNRYNQNNYLEKIKNTTNEYKLVTSSLYLRNLLLEDSTYAIDLEGGPMICEGNYQKVLIIKWLKL